MEPLLTSPSGAIERRRCLNLEARRARKGLSLRQIAESTKISPRFLLAIENEEFHLLPGGIFTTSYLRQYAEAIGCDAGELLEAAGCNPGRTGASEEGNERSNTRGLGWRSAAHIRRLF